MKEQKIKLVEGLFKDYNINDHKNIIYLAIDKGVFIKDGSIYGDNITDNKTNNYTYYKYDDFNRVKKSITDYGLIKLDNDDKEIIDISSLSYRIDGYNIFNLIRDVKFINRGYWGNNLNNNNSIISLNPNSSITQTLYSCFKKYNTYNDLYFRLDFELLEESDINVILNINGTIKEYIINNDNNIIHDIIQDRGLMNSENYNIEIKNKSTNNIVKFKVNSLMLINLNESFTNYVNNKNLYNLEFCKLIENIGSEYVVNNTNKKINQTRDVFYDLSSHSILNKKLENYVYIFNQNIGKSDKYNRIYYSINIDSLNTTIDKNNISLFVDTDKITTSNIHKLIKIKKGDYFYSDFAILTNIVFYDINANILNLRPSEFKANCDVYIDIRFIGNSSFQEQGAFSIKVVSNNGYNITNNNLHIYKDNYIKNGKLYETRQNINNISYSKSSITKSNGFKTIDVLLDKYINFSDDRSYTIYNPLFNNNKFSIIYEDRYNRLKFKCPDYVDDSEILNLIDHTVINVNINSTLTKNISIFDKLKIDYFTNTYETSVNTFNLKNINYINSIYNNGIRINPNYPVKDIEYIKLNGKLITNFKYENNIITINNAKPEDTIEIEYIYNNTPNFITVDYNIIDLKNSLVYNELNHIDNLFNEGLFYNKLYKIFILKLDEYVLQILTNFYDNSIKYRLVPIYDLNRAENYLFINYVDNKNDKYKITKLNFKGDLNSNVSLNDNELTIDLKLNDLIYSYINRIKELELKINEIESKLT